MAFVKLESENTDLSWVIEKDPNRGIVIKPFRKGYFFGYFPLDEEKKVLPNQYCIYFKDVSDETSYKVHPDAEFEYLSKSQYNDARFINDSIHELMHSARDNNHLYLGEGKDYDVPTHHKITFNVIETEYKTIDIFQRYFTNLKIISENIGTNNFKISFETKEKTTLSFFLKTVNLFGIFAVLNSKTYTYIDEVLIAKYLKFLTTIDVPYFIRYLFKVRLLRNENKFLNAKADLEKTSLYKTIELKYGDTHDARIDWIKSQVSDEFPIIDIGAGIDCKYLKIFAPKLQDKGLKYFAIENDFDARERMKAVVRNKALDNVEIFENLEEFLSIYKQTKETRGKERFNIICTEVLEHNELKEVKKILNTILHDITQNIFIITVPNHDFNQFYGIENMRHEDHKWEMNQKDFQKFITESVKVDKLDYQWYGVGDKVNDIPVSTGLIIKASKTI